MLKGKLIHPDILASLALCGHTDKILIADGNYPIESRTGDAELVYLGLAPGLPTVTQVLEAVQSVVAIEKAEVMDTGDLPEPEVFGQFREMLGLELEKVEHEEFLDRACEDSVRLAISTGEKRLFSNIMLTIGCPE